MAVSVKLLLWDCERAARGRERIIRFADCTLRDWVSYWHAGKLHSSGGVSNLVSVAAGVISRPARGVIGRAV